MSWAKRGEAKMGGCGRSHESVTEPALLFHHHEEIVNRTIRPTFGRSDFVADTSKCRSNDLAFGNPLRLPPARRLPEWKCLRVCPKGIYVCARGFSFSTRSMSSDDFSPKALEIKNTVLRLGIRPPRSSSDINVGCSPARSARDSCVSPFSKRTSLKTCPNALLSSNHAF